MAGVAHRHIGPIEPRTPPKPSRESGADGGRGSRLLTLGPGSPSPRLLWEWGPDLARPPANHRAGHGRGGAVLICLGVHYCQATELTSGSGLWACLPFLVQRSRTRPQSLGCWGSFPQGEAGGRAVGRGEKRAAKPLNPTGTRRGGRALSWSAGVGRPGPAPDDWLDNPGRVTVPGGAPTPLFPGPLEPRQPALGLLAAVRPSAEPGTSQLFAEAALLPLTSSALRPLPAWGPALPAGSPGPLPGLRSRPYKAIVCAGRAQDALGQKTGHEQMSLGRPG